MRCLKAFVAQMPDGKASIGTTKPAIVERSLKDRHCTLGIILREKNQ